MNDGEVPPRWFSDMTQILAARGAGSRRVIWHQNRKHANRARQLLATVKNFAGEKRAAVVLQVEDHAARATTGRNLYRCEVCWAWGMWAAGWEAWGTLDESDAFVCSPACKASFRPRRERGGVRCTIVPPGVRP